VRENSKKRNHPIQEQSAINKQQQQTPTINQSTTPGNRIYDCSYAERVYGDPLLLLQDRSEATTKN
jgi:hypothetical protein